MRLEPVALLARKRSAPPRSGLVLLGPGQLRVGRGQLILGTGQRAPDLLEACLGPSDVGWSCRELALALSELDPGMRQLGLAAGKLSLDPRRLRPGHAQLRLALCKVGLGMKEQLLRQGKRLLHLEKLLVHASRSTIRSVAEALVRLRQLASVPRQQPAVPLGLMMRRSPAAQFLVENLSFMIDRRGLMMHALAIKGARGAAGLVPAQPAVPRSDRGIVEKTVRCRTGRLSWPDFRSARMAFIRPK